MSQNLRPRYDRHFMGITWHNMWSLEAQSLWKCQYNHSLSCQQSVFQRYHSEKHLWQFYPQDGRESQLALNLRHCHPMYNCKRRLYLVALARLKYSLISKIWRRPWVSNGWRYRVLSSLQEKLSAVRALADWLSPAVPACFQPHLETLTVVVWPQPAAFFKFTTFLSCPRHCCWASRPLCVLKFWQTGKQ